jgi:hypothetical protein
MLTLIATIGDIVKVVDTDNPGVIFNMTAAEFAVANGTTLVGSQIEIDIIPAEIDLSSVTQERGRNLSVSFSDKTSVREKFGG